MTPRRQMAVAGDAILGMRVLLDFLGLAAKGVAAGIMTCVVLAALVLLFSGVAGAANVARGGETRLKDVETGSLLIKAQGEGLYRRMPLLETDVDMQVSGIVARTRVKQQFRNPTGDRLEAIYVFPLPENAAVDHLTMHVGKRVIEGQIKERESARRVYDRARSEGRSATLMEQERSNIFTNSVANIGPGETVIVEMEYQQTLRYDQGAFRLRFPMVVGPRYIPGDDVVAGVKGSGWAPNTNVVSDAARVTPPVLPPEAGPINPVRLRVELDSGFPLATLSSTHHRVSVASGSGSTKVITLNDGAVPADRDFELVWTPAAERMPQAAIFTERHENRTYALLMVMPPQAVEPTAKRIPREVVFIIDTSGSMAGQSIEQAREALLLALDRLTPEDRFNVIEFNSVTTALFRQARAVDGQSLGRARAFVGGLKAQGGTEMAAALNAALKRSDDPNVMRQVIFLTDGAVGNEDQLFRIIHDKLGDSRLFTVGIGSAPNGHFMTKAAQFGHGTFTYIGNIGEVKQKMSELFSKLENPLMSDIKIEWPAGAAGEMWPQRIPDLYLGEPVMLSAAFEGNIDRVIVSGRRGDEAWRVVLPADRGEARPGIGVLWARHKIAALMDRMRAGSGQEEIRSAVIAVALEHHLVSKYTSLVAVDTTQGAQLDKALHTVAVPTNLPHGWQYDAVFGQLPQTATPGPLHATLGLLAIMLAALLWCLRLRAPALDRFARHGR